MALEKLDETNLHILDFMVQNTNNVSPQREDGNTPLHVAALNNKTEGIKLLLRGKAVVNAGRWQKDKNNVLSDVH